MLKKNDQNIKDVLKEFVHQKKISSGYYTASITEVWNKLMNTSIQKHTKSIRFSKGSLFVLIDSAPLKNELFLEKEKLKKLINNHLEEEIIKEIYFK